MNTGPIIRAMRHNRFRVLLIVVEIAVTLAIVTNCINIIVVQRKAMTRPSGFDDENLLQVSANNYGRDLEDVTYLRRVIDEDIRQIRSVPGVAGAASTYFLPWQGGGSSGYVARPGSHERFQTQLYPATADIFNTLGVRISEGRGFTDADYVPNPDPNQGSRAYVITRALARKIFGSASPVGKIVTSTDGSRTFHIVGVIDDFYNPYGWPIHEFALFGSRRAGSSSGEYYLVRTAPGAMKSVTAALEAKLLANNRNRIVEVQRVSDVKDRFFSAGRLTVIAMTTLIVILVFITVLGIIGMTSLSVAERTRQIGTRRALGATRPDIVRHFLIENWIITSAGLALGVLAAYGLNLALVTKLSDAKLNPALLAAGMVILWISGLAATIPPALRAASVSPATATRNV